MIILYVAVVLYDDVLSECESSEPPSTGKTIWPKQKC
jgi:hypothetical protein